MTRLLKSCQKGNLRYGIYCLAVCVGILGLIPNTGGASVVPTDKMTYDRDADLAKIQVVLEKEVVAQRLADFGLTPEEVGMRMERLTDQQVHQMAAQIDELAPGGQLEGLLVLLLLVLLVWALWYFDIISFKKPPKKNQNP